MTKNWLSYEEQVELLSQRGLRIDEREAAAVFLSRMNYYRFSGYFRHWQRDPKNGDNQFIEGTSFDMLHTLYEAEQELVTVVDRILHPLEMLVRTRFAYAYAKLVGTPGLFPHGEGFTQKPDAERVEKSALRDLYRSEATFIAHYRDEKKQGTIYHPKAYDQMPIWVAVEVFSFGNLSRLITASRRSGVLNDMADSMHTSPKILPSQIRSFVYLRNRIAHCAQLWNHSVLDKPGLRPKTIKHVRRNYRTFSDHSIYKVLVALDDIATKSEIRTGWLEASVEPILNRNPLLAHGIAHPAKYGEMPPDLLTQALP